MFKVSVIIFPHCSVGEDQLLSLRDEACDEISERFISAPGALKFARYNRIAGGSPISAATGDGSIIGSEEYWFKSEAAARDFFSTNVFYSTTSGQHPYLEACVEIAGTVAPIWNTNLELNKILILGSKKQELSIQQYRDYWIGVHGPLAMRNPAARALRGRVEYCAADRSQFTGLTLSMYDGIASIYFKESFERFRREMFNEYYRTVLAPDELKFSDPNRCCAVVVEESRSYGDLFSCPRPGADIDNS